MNNNNAPAILAITAQQLTDIKRESRTRQFIAATVLGGAAILAVLTSPSIAIVFAALSVAAVWVSPAGRRLVRGEHLVLRDPQGSPRIVLSVAADGGALLSLLDDQERSRISLGLSRMGPSLQLIDEEGQGTLTVSSLLDMGAVTIGGDSRRIMLVADDKKVGISLEGPCVDGGPSLALVTPFGVQVRQAENTCGMSATRESSRFSCESSQGNVEIFTGISPNVGIHVKSASGEIVSQVGPNGPVLSAYDSAGGVTQLI